MIVELGIVEIVSGIIVIISGVLGVTEFRLSRLKEETQLQMEHLKELNEVKLESLKQDLSDIQKTLDKVLDKLNGG